MYRSQLEFLDSGDTAYVKVLDEMLAALPRERMYPDSVIEAESQVLAGFAETRQFVRTIELAERITEFAEAARACRRIGG